MHVRPDVVVPVSYISASTLRWKVKTGEFWEAREPASWVYTVQ